jgi:hypothetical protein
MILCSDKIGSHLRGTTNFSYMDRFIGHERLIYLGASSLINHTLKQPITIQLQHQKGGQFVAKSGGQFTWNFYVTWQNTFRTDTHNALLGSKDLGHRTIQELSNSFLRVVHWYYRRFTIL